LHYGQPLALLATMPGDRSTEREIHERFSHLRLGKTEQFQPGRDLLEFIGKPLLVGINPAVVEAIPGRAVAVRLSDQDHKRLDRIAKAKGLNMAAYSRMAILERLKADEEAEK
jgi:hypothetical protein